MRLKARSSVLLPEPLGPTSAVIRPRASVDVDAVDDRALAEADAEVAGDDCGGRGHTGIGRGRPMAEAEWLAKQRIRDS